MAYSELIKSFEKIREYVAQFYIYGFKSRSQYTSKSARSYDNERRRIESWLGEYMQFYRSKNGKSSFIALDSRAVSHNPLYNAFKAKSFTENDINLHFYILDILAEGEKKSLKEIIACISSEYLSMFESSEEPDESTIRKKLKEYEKLGLIRSEKIARELFYSRNEDNVNLESWKDAAAFYSEEDVLGVIGSFVLDKYEKAPDYFSFKHHYILHALESEILEDLFCAMREHKQTELSIYVPRQDNIRTHTILPLKIYCSTQSGRRYVLGYHYSFRRMVFFRLDNIRRVIALDCDEQYHEHYSDAEKYKKNIWGVATSKSSKPERVEMTVFVSENEQHVINRLEREKRNGTVVKIDDNRYLFSAEVADASELLPWIRSFIGRIEKLESTNEAVENTFYSDIDAMMKMYGGGENAF